jgi:hypothetical protein
MLTNSCIYRTYNSTGSIKKPIYRKLLRVLTAKKRTYLKRLFSKVDSKSVVLERRQEAEKFTISRRNIRKNITAGEAT